MPRTPRLDFPGARHHGWNRGPRRAPIVHDDTDREAFLETLGRLPDRFGVRVHSYALMTNHFHGLFTSDSGRLSAALKHLEQVHAVRYNRIHQVDGPAWRGRFRNRVVERDDYWRHLFAYLHANPARAGLPEMVASPLWTSHSACIGATRTPEWLDLGPFIEAFGSVATYQAYLTDLLAGRAPIPEGFDPEGLWAPGSTDVLVAPARPPDAAAILEAVTRVTGRGLLDMHGPRAPEGEVAAWALHALGGYRQSDVAALLGVTRSTVAMRLARAQRQLGERSPIALWMRGVRALLQAARAYPPA